MNSKLICTLLITITSALFVVGCENKSNDEPKAEPLFTKTDDGFSDSFNESVSTSNDSITEQEPTTVWTGLILIALTEKDGTNSGDYITLELIEDGDNRTIVIHQPGNFNYQKNDFRCYHTLLINWEKGMIDHNHRLIQDALTWNRQEHI